MPFFSVIIPTFNRVNLCRAAVESVLHQEFRDFELIVVDDGSTDGTPNVLAQYGDRLRLLRQENKGQSVARNTAISAATGEYVAFLDSDDQWFPWTLATLQRAIEEGGKPAMIAGRSVPFWGQLPAFASIDRAFSMRHFDNALDFYARSEAIILETGTLVIRSDVLRSIGGFAPTRNNSEDIDLCLRLGTAPGFVRLESPPLFAKLSHSDNIGLELGRSADGLLEIFRHERAGDYPGGNGGRRARLRLIGAASREATSHAARRGQIGLAWRLYRRTAFWNLQLGRFRFFFGIPPLAMVGFIRSRGGPVRS
jgi:glycosyltransferase involved in cell wall biosynthesis